MLDSISEYFTTEPKRVTELGKAFLWAAFIALFAGAIEHIAQVATGHLSHISGSTGHLSLLSELPQGFPTWWVPETPEGFVFYFALALIGLGIAFEGKKLAKQFSH
jgi:hypothetical protein